MAGCPISSPTLLRFHYEEKGRRLAMDLPSKIEALVIEYMERYGLTRLDAVQALRQDVLLHRHTTPRHHRR